MVLAAASAFLKLSGAGENIIMLTFALLGLAGLYLFFALMLFREESSAGVLNILTGIVLAFTCLSLASRFIFWPESEVLLSISIIFLLAIGFFLHFRKQYSSRLILQRLIPMFIVSLILFTIPARSLISFQYRNDPQRASLQSEYYENPGDTTAEKKLIYYLSGKSQK